MTRLLIIEHGDQDRHGIDTVLMVVPEKYDKADVFDTVDLVNPVIVDSLAIDAHGLDAFIQLGEYRAFIG